MDGTPMSILSTIITDEELRTTNQPIKMLMSKLEITRERFACVHYKVSCHVKTLFHLISRYRRAIIYY